MAIMEEAPTLHALHRDSLFCLGIVSHFRISTGISEILFTFFGEATAPYL